MATIHLFLTGKGGVGKSFSASLLYQYLRKKPYKLVAYDTDPVNSTFAGYADFQVNTLEIMKDDDINPGAFDQLMEGICGLEHDDQVVVDNGASCFVSLCSYLKGNEALDVLQAEGHEVLIHSIVTGGGALTETLNELRTVTRHFPNIPLVVWLNPYFGDISIDGQKFQEFKFYQEASASIRAIIEIPPVKQALFGKDLENLLAKKWSFEAGVNSNLPLMSRQRLKTMWRNIVQALKGQPSLLVLDEAWIMLGNPVFRAKIREWLKVLRKANCAVVLATQSLSDAARSEILDVLAESCPTKVFLPNFEAANETQREQYRGLGLNLRQIEMIARATPKRDYYVVSRDGRRLMQLALGRKALAFLGASGKEDISHLKGTILQFPKREEWVPRWLEYKQAA